MTLASFILRRMLALLVLLLVVSALVFVGTELLPGDVAQVALGPFASPENVAALRRELGLDQPALHGPVGHDPRVVGGVRGGGHALDERVQVRGATDSRQLAPAMSALGSCCTWR